ncbi:hypothetical protein LCGC14_2234710, partial [marine sediment metagenome]
MMASKKVGPSGTSSFSPTTFLSSRDATWPFGLWSRAPTAAAIQKSLDDPEVDNRAVAAYALGRIGPAARAALPKLQAELTSPESLVRVASAYALVHVAPDNQGVVRAALPVLVQGLRNPNAA